MKLKLRSGLVLVVISGIFGATSAAATTPAANAVGKSVTGIVVSEKNHKIVLMVKGATSQLWSAHAVTYALERHNASSLKPGDEIVGNLDPSSTGSLIFRSLKHLPLGFYDAGGVGHFVHPTSIEAQDDKDASHGRFTENCLNGAVSSGTATLVNYAKMPCVFSDLADVTDPTTEALNIYHRPNLGPGSDTGVYIVGWRDGNALVAKYYVPSAGEVVLGRVSSVTSDDVLFMNNADSGRGNKTVDVPLSPQQVANYPVYTKNNYMPETTTILDVRSGNNSIAAGDVVVDLNDGLLETAPTNSELPYFTYELMDLSR